MKQVSTVVAVAIALSATFLVPFPAQGDTKMENVYRKIRAESPLHVFVRLVQVNKPKTPLGTCNVSGVVTRVHRTVNSNWRLLKKIQFTLKCKQKNAVVSPKDPVQWVDAKRLRRGTLLDAYLVPTGATGTFKPAKFNLVRIVSQRVERNRRAAK